MRYIEYRTAAIYHACDSALESLDHVQDKLLEAAGASKVDVVLKLNLAPLAARRDIALLGLIHRTVLGGGPNHFKKFFKLAGPHEGAHAGRHRLQLIEDNSGHWTDFAFPGSRPAEYIRRSMFGLVGIYNRLPAEVVEAASTVGTFQSGLQRMLKDAAASGVIGWERIFSPR